MARWAMVLVVACVVVWNAGCQSSSQKRDEWLDSFRLLDDGTGWLMDDHPPAGTDRPQSGSR